MAVAEMIAPTKRLITVDEYYKMAEAGIFQPDEQVELIEGEIIKMSPASSEHGGLVKRLIRLLMTHIEGRAILAIQDPLHLGALSEPEPDVMLLHWREDDYMSAHPTANDVYLLIEVAKSTLRFDQTVKTRVYAAAGVPELWIVNVEAKQIEVYREPAGSTYTTTLTITDGQTVAPLALPDLTLTWTQLFS